MFKTVFTRFTSGMEAQNIQDGINTVLERVRIHGRVKKSEESVLPYLLRLSSVAVAAILTISCTNMSEEIRYEREDKLIQVREEFLQKRIACENIGGAMAIQSFGSRIKRDYTYEQYKTAECTAWKR